MSPPFDCKKIRVAALLGTLSLSDCGRSLACHVAPQMPPRGATWILVALCTFSIIQSCGAQNPPPSAAPNSTGQGPVQPPQSPIQQPWMPVLDSTKLLVDFQKNLSDAAKTHQEFLE